MGVGLPINWPTCGGHQWMSPKGGLPMGLPVGVTSGGLPMGLPVGVYTFSLLVCAAGCSLPIATKGCGKVP